ncbi:MULTISPECIES: LysR family transcriptional regulator [unclassified Caballeronia]|uniref:LysR family transcriptional regulator n=1 Tax=unclassified Caballeronia TaxID=2646786 RepID=UPI0028665B53|nr:MULTISPECIES: LysR family transcriptional regulator [unclassified Caballeronia]MDR5816275.1 LysR family transcriptional regulator [Caballeronia sp. LZ033]MDR5881002.1 LysR family transcriptional regulator [Caballeronia sp. LZ032]
MDLVALVDFNAVALHGGFGPAARQTGRPKATLSRHVAELEQSLGVRLIERGARTLRLTEEGRALHERTRGLLAEIDDAGEALAARAPVPRGRLRVSAPIVFAHVMLPGIASRYARHYPQVELEIVAEDRVADPVQDGYDLVIRVNPDADELLVGRCVATDRRTLVGPRGFKAEADAPTLPAVVLARMANEVWRIEDPDGGTRALTPEPVLRLSSLLMAREAVLQGAGAALLPGMLVEADVAAGRLELLGYEAGPPVELWALYSSRRLLSAKVRAFIDMLNADYDA